MSSKHEENTLSLCYLVQTSSNCTSMTYRTLKLSLDRAENGINDGGERERQFKADISSENRVTDLATNDTYIPESGHTFISLVLTKGKEGKFNRMTYQRQHP